jgi:hypothetical protein
LASFGGEVSNDLSNFSFRPVDQPNRVQLWRSQTSFQYS